MQSPVSREGLILIVAIQMRVGCTSRRSWRGRFSKRSAPALRGASRRSRRISNARETGRDSHTRRQRLLLSTDTSTRVSCGSPRRTRAPPFLECCIRRALDYLRGLDLIAQKQTALDIECERGAYEEYNATQLGSAMLNSAIEIGVGLGVCRDLSRARRCLCLDNDLHLVYLVTNCAALLYCV